MAKPSLTACDICGRPCAGKRGLPIHKRLMHSGRDYSAERRVYSARPRRKKTPEQIEKMRKLGKELWTRPEFVKRMKEIAHERWTPELRARLSEKTGERMRLDENREKQRKSLTQKYQDPDFRQAMSEQTSRRIANGELKIGRTTWRQYTTLSGKVVNLLGSFEERVARALDLAGYQWEQNRDRFRYRSIDGVPHWYTPDFKIQQGARTFYVEVKGYLDITNLLKLYSLIHSGLPRMYILFEEGIELLEDGADPFTEDRELSEVISREIEKQAAVR